MLDQESHRVAERLAYLGRSLSRDTVWGQKVSRHSSPELQSQSGGHRKPRDEVPFACECRMALRRLPGSSDLSQSRKELYWNVVVGFASDPFIGRLGCSMGEIRSQ